MLNKTKSLKQRMNTLSLAWPIFIETSIRMFFLSLDTLMLSAYSDKAVAAVGLISQMMFFVIIFYNMVSTGAGIVITQYIGAQKDTNVQRTISASICLMIALSLTLGGILKIFCPNIVALFDLEKDVYAYAYDFFSIFAIFSIAFALNTLFVAILRSYGYTREPMFISIFALGINVVGNYLFIFGKFGLPILGVKGVAYSTVFSQGISACLMLIMMKRFDVPITIKKFSKIPGEIYKNILKIGIPNGLESLSYNLSQLAILKLIALLGTVTLTAYSYALTIQRFIFVIPMSIAQATQILTSYYSGADENDKAYKTLFKNCYFAFFIALFVSIIFIIFRYQLTGIFTSNKEVIMVTTTIISMMVFQETGRSFNMIIIFSLKGAGDVKFPVYMGIISMWGISVFLSYTLCIVLSFGIIGIWIAMSADEWFRGIIMLFRWKSKKWMNKSVIKEEKVVLTD